MTINSTRNEEFPVKTLEDQQKVYVAFMKLISTLGALGHCAIWKYINQNWMEGVITGKLLLMGLAGIMMHAPT